MEPDRGRRYQSAADLAADLRACLDGRSPAASNQAASSARSRVITAESPDGQCVAVALSSGLVIVLDMTSGASLSAVRGDGTPVDRLSFESSSRLTIGRVSGTIERITISHTA
jgi:hypothetical protein